jgi:Lipase (class 3)
MNSDQLDSYAYLCSIAYKPMDQALQAYIKLGYSAKVLAHNQPLEKVYALQKEDELTFVIAGTDQPLDWLINLFAIPKAYVHPGYSQVASSLAEPIRECFQSSGADRINLVGHSKGGAVAAILLRYLWQLPVTAISFGSPRIGSKLFAETHPNEAYYRVVHPEDIVARVPTHNLGYRHCGKPIVYDGQTYQESPAAWIKAQENYPLSQLVLSLRRSIAAHSIYWNE